MQGVYKITNLITNKSYIGISVNLKKRIYDHKRLLKLNKHKNSHLQASYNLYKENNFKFEILIQKDFIKTDLLIWLEKRLIIKFNCINNGYNQIDGGGYCRFEDKSIKSKDNIIAAARRNAKLGNQARWRKVEGIKDGISLQYLNIKLLAEDLNLDLSNIHKVLKGKSKSIKGYFIRYL